MGSDSIDQFRDKRSIESDPIDPLILKRNPRQLRGCIPDYGLTARIRITSAYTVVERLTTG